MSPAWDRLIGPLGRAPVVTRRAVVLAAAVAGVALLLAAPELWAQAAEPLSAQRLGRPYRFLFVGYALVWLLVAGWVVSIARRLARVEKRLQSD